MSGQTTFSDLTIVLVAGFTAGLIFAGCVAYLIICWVRSHYSEKLVGQAEAAAKVRKQVKALLFENTGLKIQLYFAEKAEFNRSDYWKKHSNSHPSLPRDVQLPERV